MKGELFQITTLLPEENKSIENVPVLKDTKKIDYTNDFFKKPSFLTCSG